MNRVFYDNRLVAAGSQGDKCNWYFHQFRQEFEIIQCLLGQIFQRPTIFGGLLPSWHGLVDGLASRKPTRAAGKVLAAFAVDFVGNTNFDFFEGVENVE